MQPAWHADANGWWVRCNPDPNDQPFIVRITLHGELQFAAGPAIPLLTWQAAGQAYRAYCDTITDARITPLPGTVAGTTLVLPLTCGPSQVELRITCFPSLGVVRLGGSITASQPLAALADCRWQWAIPIPNTESAHPVQLHRIQGVRLFDQSSFPVSFLEVNQPLRRGPLAWGADAGQTAAHPTSSNMWLPWLAACDHTGTGAAFGIQWSGLWKAQAEWVPGAAPGSSAHVLVSLGSVFTCNVAGGSAVELPPAFVALTQNGLRHVSQQIHTYTRTAVKAQTQSDTMPWVQFNSWYPWRAKLHDSEMEKQLGLAAQLGFEVFVLDDGWFLGGYEGAPWGAGAGWWIEDPAKFPSGIKAFGEKVHANGLKFGLWIEPERVDTRVLPQTGIRQAWLAGDEDNQPFAPHKSGSGQQLCLGCPEGVAWAKQQLDRLVGEYGADWIKWDHNRYQVCRRSDHGHQAGDGNRAHILGVYEVLRYLRERYPHVVVENCAAGGTRVDYGLMQYTDVTWLHDIPSPSYRARSQFAGASQAYPPEYLNAWVIPDTWEPLTERNARYKLRSCMLGAFGVSYPLYDLSSPVLSILKEEIAHYKRLRPLITHGRCVPLLPQPTSLSAWSAQAYLLHPTQQVSGDSPCGAILAFRGNHESGSRQRLQVPGLAPETQFRVADQDSGHHWLLSGIELAEQGIEITLAEPDSSALLWLFAAEV